MTGSGEKGKTLHVWQLLDMLFTKVTRFGFKALGNTIRTETTKELTANDFYTEPSGLKNTAQFLNVMSSIIKMAIGETTTSETFKQFKFQNTAHATCGSVLRIPSIVVRTHCILKRQSLSPQHGIAQKMALNGTERMAI